MNKSNQHDRVSAIIQIMKKVEGSKLSISQYFKQNATPECVNAIARNRGLQQFTVHGFSISKITILWFAIAHNWRQKAALWERTA